MQRDTYNNLPNRIIPPHQSYIDTSYRRPTNDYEAPRAGRMQQGSLPMGRPSLLGDQPNYGRQPTQFSDTYNGPVVDNSRRRGFDKGPYGEDLAVSRVEPRQPLLRTPVAVERVGGDMEISRSRSSSPITRLVSARSVRDDRKRDRDRARRSSRSRSRSRDRDRDRRTKPSRTDSYPMVAHDQIRDGIVWTSDNYYEFLSYFVDLLNEEAKKSADRDVQGVRKLREDVTKASESEKIKILLPPEFDRSDREKMLHCDSTIDGLPAAIFFGSGYGPRSHYAKFSAAKDLVDKCHRIGVINSELHAAIGDSGHLDRSFQRQYSVQITKAVNAVILLIKRMVHENLPIGFMTNRQLDPEVIDRFKIMLRMVMIDVYYQGREAPSVPKDLQTGYMVPPSRESFSSSHMDSDIRRRDERSTKSSKESRDTDYRGSKSANTEQLLAQKEKELKEQMEVELAKKRIEMEQELRQKILEEERAKIRAELEREKKLEMMMQEQQKYQSEREKEKKEFEEQQQKSLMLKKVEDDFNALVEKLEQQFVEIRNKGMTHILDMIYSSATFKTIQVYSTTLTSITFEQKQQLVVDLKALLDSISMSMSAVDNSQGYGYSMMTPGMPSAIPVPVPAAIPVPPAPKPSNQQSSSSRDHQVRRLTVGDMRLRSLNASEKRQLKQGNKVIAQDVKTGNWQLASVVKVRDDRVTLSVAGAAWKKYIDEVYIEDDNAPLY